MFINFLRHNLYKTLGFFIKKMGILDGIKKAFDMLPNLADSAGALVLGIMFIAMLIGVIQKQVSDGNIDAGQEAGELINNSVSNFSEISSGFYDSTTAIIGFIIIGVLLLVFGGMFLKRKFGNSKL